MSDKQKIIERIKKLLALAGRNSSVEEAAAAAAKAQELLERYSIEEAMLADPEAAKSDIITRTIWQGGGEKSGKVATWLIQLASGITRVNRCRMWFRSMFRGQPGRITGCGTEENIERVQVMLDWLIFEVNRLYIEERPACFDKSAGRRWANAFRLGAASTIVKRLDAALEKARQEMQNGSMSPEEASRYRQAVEEADIETIIKMDNAQKRYLPATVQTAIAKLDAEAERVNAWVKSNQKLGKPQKRNLKGNYEAGYAMGVKAGERARLTQEQP